MPTSARTTRNTARSKAATKSDKPRSKPGPRKKEEPTNREVIRKEEAARREQTYDFTFTEHQRALLVRRLEVIGSARTKPEEELLDMLRSKRANPASKTPARKTRRRRSS